MEFLFVNYVLYLLYISKIYDKLMYVGMQTFSGEPGIKHHWLELSVGPTPSTHVSLTVHKVRGREQAQPQRHWEPLLSCSDKLQAAHHLPLLLGFGAHLVAPFIQQ